LASFQYGSLHNLVYGKVILEGMIRYPLLVGDMSPELRAAWTEAQKHLGITSLGLRDVALRGKELIGLPVNLCTTDELNLCSKVAMVRKYGNEIEETLETMTGDLIHDALHPLSGWLSNGFWRSMSRTRAWLQGHGMLRTLHVKNNHQVTLRMLNVLRPTSAQCKLRLEALVRERWHPYLQPGIASRMARHIDLVIRSLVQHSGLACTAAFLRLLLQFGTVHVRHQHPGRCCWCEDTHFSTDWRALLVQGCYRKILGQRRKFHFLLTATPDCWVQLAIGAGDSRDSTKNLGAVSYALVNAIHMCKYKTKASQTESRPWLVRCIAAGTKRHQGA